MSSLDVICVFFVARHRERDYGGSYGGGRGGYYEGPPSRGGRGGYGGPSYRGNRLCSDHGDLMSPEYFQCYCLTEKHEISQN